ncbi:MAG: hypothetical protein FJ027_10665 [Candidatus Rokubacteria bacterium]|nr:hypothetical protein [Candidatus Rokubacteria bacterium]
MKHLLLLAGFSLMPLAASGDHAPMISTRLYRNVFPQGEITVGTPPPARIQPKATAHAVPDARPSGRGGVSRRFANDRLNGRVGVELPRGTWEVAWQVDLDPRYPADALLAADERILILSPLQWSLLDGRGRPLARGPRGGSDVVLAADRGLFHEVDAFGAWTARSLADGTTRYHTLLPNGASFARYFVVAHQTRHVAVGIEQPLGAHDGEGRAPRETLIEAFSAPEPIETDETAMLRSATESAELRLDTLKTAAAHDDGMLVLALADTVLWLDLKLQPVAAFEDRFAPEMLSLDETRTAYLVAETGTRHQLSAITSAGERLYMFELPKRLVPLRQPPIVGYDHGVYLLSERMIVALAADGEIRWARPAAAGFAGGFVTGNGQLLASDGGEVVAFDEDGQRRSLYAFVGERRLTSPVLTDAGEILVASEKVLYCLVRRPGRPAPEP